MPHPVRVIGWFCSTTETFFRKHLGSEYCAGVLSFITVLFGTVALAASFLAILHLIFPVLAQIFAVFLLYTCIAARDLVVHSRRVYLALQRPDTLSTAREAVAEIVGRDTKSLDRKGIIKACIETVAENMVDGVTAPLFYAILFSTLSPVTGIDPLFLAVTGAMGYKAVNTMDSMFGYKNDRYIAFGRMAAKADDFVNLLPARISGLIVIPAAFVLGLDWKNAFFVYKRDRFAHASPNAAHTEAAVAGALTIQLGGTSIYFGKEIVKPHIGDDSRSVTDKDILLSNHLMLISSLFFVLLLLILRHFFMRLFL